MKISIDVDKIIRASKPGSEFTLNSDVEPELTALLEARDEINEAISQIEEAISTKLTEENPINRSITGRKVRFTLRSYGPRYSVDTEKADPAFSYSKPRFYPEKAAIDKYVEEKGHLPAGVTETSRKLKAKLELINKLKGDEEA